MALSLHIVCSMERMELIYRGVRESEYHSRLIVVMVHMLFVARQATAIRDGQVCDDRQAVEDAIAAEEQSVEDGQARWSETGNTRRC